MKKYVLLFAGVLTAISCSEQADLDKNKMSERIVALAKSNNPDYKPHVINEALDGEYDAYLEFFVGTDYEIGISSSKDGGLPGGSKISCISGPSQVRNPNLTKAPHDCLPPITASANGIVIEQQPFAPTKAPNGITNCFGNMVSFSFKTQATTKADDTTKDVEMYVPKAIQFLSPYAESENDLNPLCFFRNFLIKWNADENNQNGVVVAVDWNGSMVLGDDIPDTHVCRLATFPDTGEALLPEELFDGIPDTALCDLILLRGNIDNVEHGQYTYKLVGKTHHLISFILIREIKKL